ncbi:MAG: glutamate formimidoyltransferase [Chitinophagales bacterium]
MTKKLIECVPNFSEGRNMDIIKQITQQIESVEGVQLLDIDPGKATNRTVVTFVGEPEPVIEAAFLAMKKAAELIDMRQHHGEHPRFGATDVCPLVPISGISMEETVKYAQKLAKRVGEELQIPIYLYESAASRPERKNLATIRAGQYEGLAAKLKHPDWKPDAGPAEFNESVQKSGVTAVGARDFLIAYNVNLNTTSVRRANAVAFDVREAGRAATRKGKVLRNKKGEALRKAGKLKAVKGIGWYIEEYGICQVSMNLTDIKVTPFHTAFEAVCDSANSRGMRVTGSELVGLVPLKVMLDAGKRFLEKQKRSTGIAESEIIKIAIKTMGLDELSEFNPRKKIIEYILADNAKRPLVNMSLKAFAAETASESPAPGGGSIAAYIGALGVALGTMVANLSAHKRGWDKRWKVFSDWAEKGQAFQSDLLYLVDEDTNAFNRIIDAVRLPKKTETEQVARAKAMTEATKYAIEVPLRVMRTALDSMVVMEAMAKIGNPNSASDAGVGAACARTAVLGAYLNVKINLGGFDDAEFAEAALKKADNILKRAIKKEKEILAIVTDKIA